jgi:adenylate kinase family enzyme
MSVLAQAITEDGTLAPDEMVDAMVERRLAEPDAANGFILVRPCALCKQQASMHKPIAVKYITQRAAGTANPATAPRGVWLPCGCPGLPTIDS